MQVGKLFVKIGADLSQYKQGIEEVKKQTQGLSTQIKGALKVAAGVMVGVAGWQVLATTIKDTALAGIEFNARMQQAQIAFETFLGSADAARRMVKDLQDFAARTPFEFPQLQAAATKMLAFGFAAKDVLPVLTAVGDAAAGLGLSGEEGINRILIALGQMKAKAKVSAQEMLQLTEAGVPAWDILAKAMGKSTAEVMKLSEKGLIPANQAIEALVKGMEERFPGMMDKQSKSFAGLMSTLRDQLNMTFGAVMKPSFDWAANRGIPALIEGTKWLTSHLQEVGAAIKAVMVSFLAWVTVANIPSIITTIGSALKWLSGVAMTVANSFQYVRVAVGGLEAAYNAVTAGRSVLTFAQQMEAARAANIAFAESSAAARAASLALAEAQAAVKAALIQTGIGALVVALGLLTYKLSTAKTEAEQFVEAQQKMLETAETQVKLRQSEIAALNNQISTMQQMREEFVATAEALKGNKLRHEEAVAAQAKMKQMSQELATVIGKEAVAHIQNAKDIEKAYNQELAARQKAMTLKEAVLNRAIAKEKEITNQMIQQTLKRIEALEKEAQAIGIWAKVRAWYWEQDVKGLENQKKQILESVSGYKLTKEQQEGLKRTLQDLNQKIEESRQKLDAIKTESSREEIKKLSDELTNLLNKRKSLEEPGGVNNWNFGGMPSITPGATTSKAKKAAEDTRAAWERTADILGVKLQMLQVQQEIAGMAAEKHGNQVLALKDKIVWLNKELDVQKQIINAVNQGYEASVKAKGANSEETLKLKLRLEQEKKAQADIEKQIYETTQAMKKQAEGARELAGEIKSLEAGYDAVAKKMESDLAAAYDEYQAKIESVNKKLAEDERNLTEQFENELTRRANALANFVGLFDAVQTRDVSGQTLLENLRGQVKTFEDWSVNIQALARRGVDEGLLQELREMGPKAAPEIAALNTLTDTELNQYVALWREKNALARTEAMNQMQQQKIEMQQKLMEIRAAAQEQLEMYRVEWEKKQAEIRKNAEEELSRIEEKFKNMEKSATSYGVNLMENFMGGIRSRMSALESMLTEMAMMVDSYMPHSPAKRGPLSRIMDWGPALVNSLAEGIRRNMPSLESVMAGMGALAMPGLAPAVAASYSTSNAYYGGNNIYIQVSGGNNASDLADNLIRELARRGVKL